MNLGRILGGVALTLASLGAFLAFGVPAARSADHLDSPATKADPTVDINDLYTWVDGNNLVFVLTSDAATTPTTKFSDTVQYVLHTTSGAGFAATKGEYNIICTFDAAQAASCWYGMDGMVKGDASKEAGLASADGKFKVFAGPRSDPFFFNLDGFKKTVATVQGAAPNLMFDTGGCPKVDNATSGVLVKMLKSAADGGAPVDFFANLNALAIVVSIDKKLVTKNGPVVAAWASTNKK